MNYKDYLGFHMKKKINVIPNGVNLNLFNGIERDYNFRRQFAMDNEKNNLIYGKISI